MIEVAEGVFVETGYKGVNVGAVVTDDVLFYIDTPTYPKDARFWSDYIDRAFPRHLHYLALTDYSPDRILNARWVTAPLLAHQMTADKLRSFDKRYPVEMIDAVHQRFPDRFREISHGPVKKPSISFSERININVDDRVVSILSRPGPTPGNIWIFLPDSQVLFSGDTVVCGTFPPLSEMVSTFWLNTLESLDENEFSGYTLVPGRGDVTDSNSAAPMIEFISAMRRAVTEHIESQLPKEELSRKARDFLQYFPTNDVPRDWVLHQISTGLERIFVEQSGSKSPKTSKVASRGSKKDKDPGFTRG